MHIFRPSRPSVPSRLWFPVFTRYLKSKSNLNRLLALSTSLVCSLTRRQQTDRQTDRQVSRQTAHLFPLHGVLLPRADSRGFLLNGLLSNVRTRRAKSSDGGRGLVRGGMISSCDGVFLHPGHVLEQTWRDSFSTLSFTVERRSIRSSSRSSRSSSASPPSSSILPPGSPKGRYTVPGTEGVPVP